MVAFQNPVIQTITIPSGATTGTRIVIDGVNGTINVYDMNNVLVGQWRASDAVMMFQNDAMTGKMEFHPSGLPSYGVYPGIYFFAANTPGGYAGAAYIQANPDVNNSPQIGINSGQYIDTSGLHGARGRLFMQDHVSSLAQIDVSTQSEIGGAFESTDTTATIHYTDPTTGTQIRPFYVTHVGNSNCDQPILNDSWQNVVFSNGWGNAGGFSAVQARIDTSGYLRLRGNASGGTLTDGTVMFTLPAGYAPVSTNVLPAAVTASVNPTQLSRVIVNSSGTVQVFGVNFAGFLTVSLAGIFTDTLTYTA